MNDSTNRHTAEPIELDDMEIALRAATLIDRIAKFYWKGNGDASAVNEEDWSAISAASRIVLDALHNAKPEGELAKDLASALADAHPSVNRKGLRSDLPPAPHPIASPGPDTQAGGLSAEAPLDWRARVAELVKRALDVLRDEDEDIQMLTSFNKGNGCFAWHLVWSARWLLEDNADMLRTGVAGEYYGDVIVPALAMVLGAQGMKHTHRALPAMLEPAVAALKEAEEITPSCPAEVSGHQPPAAASIEPPAASSQAEEAPTEAARLSKVASDELHLVWHLADALCDEAVPVDEDCGRVAGMAFGIKRAIEGVAAQLEQLYFETMAAAEEEAAA